MLLAVGRWIVLRLLSLCLAIFFRETAAFGEDRLPDARTSSVIFVCAPHANQFMDPVMVMRHAGRPVGFLTAAVSMRRLVVGTLARLLNSIPVERAQDMAVKGVGTVVSVSGSRIVGEGTRFVADFPQGRDAMSIVLDGEAYVVTEVICDTELIVAHEPPGGLPNSLSLPATYKILPKVDQAVVYEAVYNVLHAGGAVGIFPEGGSHDRTTLLPLKAGFTIMALGALAKHPEMKLRIVPVGLNYFRAHRFRSTAYVEFGDPIVVEPELVELYKRGGTERRKACGVLLDSVNEALKDVTVQTSDYQMLQLLRAARRLYLPEGRKITVEQKLQLTRSFAEGWEAFHDRTDVIELKQEIENYNNTLKQFRLLDSQVPKLKTSRSRALVLLAERVVLLCVLTIVALPGLIMTVPIAVGANRVAKGKAREAVKGSTVKLAGRDVMATWKVMVGGVLVPLVWLFWVLVSVFAFGLFPGVFGMGTVEENTTLRLVLPVISVPVIPLIMYSAVIFVENGLGILRSLKPLISILAGHNAVLALQQQRDRLNLKISAMVEQLGPQAISDFARARVISPQLANCSIDD